MAVITSTAAGLSRWVGEAMTTLQNDRERTYALQRENAQVSRGAAMTQKEVVLLEAKLSKFRQEVRVCVRYNTVNVLFCIVWRRWRRETMGGIGVTVDIPNGQKRLMVDLGRVSSSDRLFLKRVDYYCRTAISGLFQRIDSYCFCYRKREREREPPCCLSVVRFIFVSGASK